MNNDFLFSNALLARMQTHHIHGVSVAVIEAGELAWAQGFGVQAAGSDTPVTADTLFQACSISKPVSAMAALALVEQGRLDLDEDVNQKLISWKIPDNEFTREKPVTLRNLLTHTAGLTVSGFRGYAVDEALPSLPQILDGLPPANSVPIRVDILPDTQWRYSGGGFTVMQQILIDSLGMPFPEIMRERVLHKLDMLHSTFQQPLPDHLAMQAASGHREHGEIVNGNWHRYPEMAAAGLWTTPSDLARLVIELQKSLVGQSNKVLSMDMTSQMLSDQMENFPRETVSKRYDRDIRNQGLGFRLEGEGASTRFSHHGGNEGYRCFLVAYRDTGQGAVVMTNSDKGFELIPEIVESLAQQYKWVEGWSKR